MKSTPFTLVVLLCLLLLQSCQQMNSFMVIGHRGAMGHETENTIASIKKALEMEVDMIEIDVFKIKSGEIVVFHDDEVDRLTNGTGLIENYTFKELEQLLVTGNHKIPTLEQVLEVIDNKIPLNIELKGDNTATDTYRIMQEQIDAGKWSEDHFVISSFKWNELEDMRALHPNVSIAVLTDDNPLDALLMAKKLEAIAINPYYKLLTKENVQLIHNAGYKVLPWTVNEEEDIKKMKEIGVDGVFTNYPERAF